MPAPSLSLKHFGMAFDGRVKVRDVNWELDKTAVVSVEGSRELSEAFCRVVCGLMNPREWTYWGAIDILGLDHRIRRPFAWVGLRSVRSEMKVRDALFSAQSDEQIVSQLTRSTSVRPPPPHLPLRALGLSELPLDTPLRQLPLEARWRLNLAVALGRGAPGVVLAADAMPKETLEAAAMVARDFGAVLCVGWTPHVVKGERLVLRPADEETEAFSVPSGLQWVRWGELGGMCRPGIRSPTSELGPYLRKAGVACVVGLEEDDQGLQLRQEGVQYRHYPIRDMDVPDLDEAASLIRSLGTRGPVVFHCKAGLGRTGTLLGASLVYRGYTPLQALNLLRRINPHYLQTEAQEAFLDRAAEVLA